MAPEERWYAAEDAAWIVKTDMDTLHRWARRFPGRLHMTRKSGRIVVPESDLKRLWQIQAWYRAGIPESEIERRLDELVDGRHNLQDLSRRMDKIESAIESILEENRALQELFSQLVQMLEARDEHRLPPEGQPRVVRWEPESL